MTEARFHFHAGPVDVHAHMTPAEFPTNTTGESRWPCMQRHSPIDATVVIADKPFRRLDDRSWDVYRRLEDMDRDGIAVQALSPMPELLSYWFDKGSAERFSDAVNSDLAEQVALAPHRFAGLGTVPMQDPGLAIRHLERVRGVYGLAGIEIGSNINGVLLGDPSFEPVWEAAEALGLAIFVHALHPISTLSLEAPATYTPMVGFPIDTAMAAASLIMAGVLDRHPGLRIGFSHGGGALAPVLHRMDYGWSVNPTMGGGIVGRPSEVAARMFYDSNVYQPAYLRYITEHLAPGRVFLGTDYPYAIMQPDPVAYAARAGLATPAQESLLWGAAHEFLNGRS